MQLFYNSEILESTSQIQFSKEESKHIIKVLRKSEGDILNITNGQGWLFIAEITFANLKQCTAKITRREFQKNRDYKIHLAVAPTKMNDRYEWFLEKATEIGVDSITPLICDRSERKIIKIDRLKKIILAAMKQSLSYYMPKINDPIHFKDFVKQPINDLKFIAHCEETHRKSLKNEVQRNKEITILIGPEGDFSVKEIEIALQNNFIPVTLGVSRLRTETAAIVACHTIALINE